MSDDLVCARLNGTRTANQVRELLLQGDAILQVPFELLAGRITLGAVDDLHMPLALPPSRQTYFAPWNR